MKLRLRRSAGRQNGGPSKLPGDSKVPRQSPPGVVTSWIRQGLSLHMCPLCRVLHKADREYIWHFYDERSNDMSAVEEVRRAFGFCAEHIEMLRRIDVEDMKTTLSISVLFVDTFTGIVEQLNSLTNASAFEPEPCPACVSRDEYLRRNAHYLLDMLATRDGYREEFEASPGLCYPHFKLVWDLARTRGDREQLLAVQRTAAQGLLHELQEHVRKHDDKFRHEPKGPERDSWRRAIFITSGWTPPGASAAEPELERR